MKSDNVGDSGRDFSFTSRVVSEILNKTERYKLSPIAGVDWPYDDNTIIGLLQIVRLE